jgi:WD40 repeat protein
LPFDAFISYSHAADKLLAPRLQSALHRIAKPWYRLRSLHVYRDTTNLALNPDLWGAIESALGESGAFIYLASPQAAASRWVQKEIDYWLARKDRQRLFIVMTGGQLAWDRESGDFDWQQSDALPRGLSGVFSAEPLWLDLRWAKQESHLSMNDPRFRDGVATLAAAITGRSKDDLIGEDVRQQRITRRNVVAGVAVLFVTTVLAIWQWQKAVRRELESRSRANAAQALVATQDLQPDLAIEFAMKANAIDAPPPEARQALAEVAYNVPGTRCEMRHGAAVTRVRFLDRMHAAVTASEDGTLRLWALAADRRCPTLRIFRGHRSAVTDVDLSRDEQRMLSASADGQLCRWQVHADTPPRCHNLNRGRIVRAAFVGDGDRAIVANDEAGLAVWDLASGAPAQTLPGPHARLRSLAVHPNGTATAAGDTEGLVCLWDLPAGAARCCNSLKDYATWGIHDLAFAPDGKRLLAGFGGYPGDISLVLINAETCAVDGKMAGHRSHNTVVAFDPEGRIAASGARDRTIALWSLADGGELMRLRGGHSGAITSVVISADGATLLSGSDDHTARWWDIRSGAEEKRIVSGTGLWLATSDNARYAVARGPGTGRHLQLWRVDVDPPKTLQPLTTEVEVLAAAVSDDGELVLIGSIDGHVHLWRPRSNSLLTLVGSHPNRTTRLIFSPDRALALSSAYAPLEGSADFSQLLILWHLSRGKALRNFVGHKRIVRDVAFSPDGRLAVSGSDDGTVRLWDVATGRERRHFDGRGGEVWAVAFSPDGTMIASGHQDLIARVWGTANGDVPRRFIGHTGEVRSVAFDPGGTRLLTGSADGTLRLWSLSDGKEIGRFSGPGGEVSRVAFSGSARRALSFSADLTLRWWDLELPGRLFEWVCENRYTREFECLASQAAPPSRRGSNRNLQHAYLGSDKWKRSTTK